jgi:hypothetical protein
MEQLRPRLEALERLEAGWDGPDSVAPGERNQPLEIGENLGLEVVEFVVVGVVGANGG